MNPAQLRRQAAKELELGRYHLQRAALLEQTAIEMEALRVPKPTRTILRMDAAQEPKRRGRPPTTTHPFPAALAKHGSSVAEWARVHGVDRVTAKAWFARGSAGRRIPSHVAKSIEREYGVPATEEVWINGIR